MGWLILGICQVLISVALIFAINTEPPVASGVAAFLAGWTLCDAFDTFKRAYRSLA